MGAIVGIGGAILAPHAAWAAPVSPTPTPSPDVVSPTMPVPAPSPVAPAVPLEDVGGTLALWFIGAVTGAVALLWIVPLIFDTRQANEWRREHQGPLLREMIKRTNNLNVEEIRQIVSAMNAPARGTFGLTQTLLGLIIATFVGVAMIATLVSTADDSGELRKTLVTALLSILATIAGFYFGARTAQTSTEQATHPPQPSRLPNGDLDTNKPDGATTDRDKAGTGPARDEAAQGQTQTQTLAPEETVTGEVQEAPAEAGVTEEQPEDGSGDGVVDDDDVTHQDEDEEAEKLAGDRVEYDLGDEKGDEKDDEKGDEKQGGA